MIELFSFRLIVDMIEDYIVRYIQNIGELCGIVVYKLDFVRLLVLL